MTDTIESGKTSQRYVPSGAIPETDPDSGAAVYSYERNGELFAIAYKPKEWCQARVTPRKDKFVSAAFKRRASIDGRVKVSSVASAYVWDGRAKHQTSYA